MIRVELYDGSQHPAVRPVKVETTDSDRKARRIAAAMLGHASLRGASTWNRHQGGTVWQFGPRSAEDSEYDYVVIRDDDDDDEQ